MNNRSLILNLHSIGAVKFGQFKLKSGILSPIYIDLRLTVSYPHILDSISDALWEKMNGLEYNLIAGVPYTALPFASVISVKHAIPMVMRRKEVKDYGTKKAIEGAFQPGQTCLIIEDLVTSGASIFETIDPVLHEGLKVKDIVVLLDREQGGRAHIESKGFRLHSVLTMTELLNTLKETEKITGEQYTETVEFIKTNQTKME